MAYVVFLAGGIASGKSTLAAELERLGAVRIDLDRVSRDVLAPGTPTTAAVVAAFGNDLLDATTGELDRRLLAERAFATPADAARLEAIELPAIRARLVGLLAEAGTSARTATDVVGINATGKINASAAVGGIGASVADGAAVADTSPARQSGPCVVIEVPLLDRVGNLADLADEVLVVCTPAELRRARAVARGMDVADVARRMANQPADAWLRAHADTVIENDGTPGELCQRARTWWGARQAGGWRRARGVTCHVT